MCAMVGEGEEEKMVVLFVFCDFACEAIPYH